MGIPVGTTTDSGVVQPKKKKKKVVASATTYDQTSTPQQQPDAQPAFPKTTEDVAKMVTAGIFGRTGRIPSTETTQAFVTAAKDDPSLETQDDFNTLFHPWLKNLEDPGSMLLTDPVVTPSNRAHKDRTKSRRPKWTKKELANLPFKDMSADETRKLANTMVEGEKMSAGEIDRIYQAREWYDPTWGAPGGGTELKARIIQRQLTGDSSAAAGDFYDPETKEPRLRGIRNWVKQTGQLSDTLMDPLQYAKLRTSLEGKDREELSPKQLEDLDGLALRFSTVYPGFADHYAEKGVVKWDAFFDKAFTRYVVDANIGYAMGMALGDDGKPEGPDGERAKQATKNIEIATGGAVPADADIHQALGYLGSLGDPDNPESPMQELSDYIFKGYYNAHAEMWSDRRTIASYVHDFGYEALPDKMKGQYQEDRSAWDVPMATLTAKKTIAGGKDVSDYDGFLESLADSIYSEDKYTLPLPAESQPPGTGQPRTTSRTGGKGYGGRNREQSLVGDPVYDFTDTTVIPFIEDYIGHPLNVGLNYVEKQKNRLFLAAAINSAREYDRRVVSNIPDEYKGTELAPRELSAPWRGKGDATDIATRLTSADPAGGRAFMEEVWRQNGWSQEEHGNLFFLSDLAWSLAVDAGLDAGVGAVVKQGGTFAASVARKTLSPKLAAKVAQAEKDVSLAAGAVSDLAREGRLIEPTGQAALRLKKAQRTLELLKRPAWYDTHAIALSKGFQRGDQVWRFFGLSDAGLNPESRRAALSLVGKIGKSRDADEVLELMNELRTMGHKLDPGAVWYGKNLRYHRIMSMNDDLAYAREAVESGTRLRGGLENIEDHIVKYGTLTRMGFANTEAGREKAARLVNEMLEKWFRIDGKTAEEIALKKRDLWDEMWKTVEDNMRARKLTKAEENNILKWARRSGTELDDAKTGWRESAWKAAKAADAIAAPRMKREPGKGKSRAYADAELAAEAGIEDTTRPVKEWQLAKDLVFPVNPQKLIAFQRGDAALSWELRQTTGLLGLPFTSFRRFGLSPDAVTTAFKQLVIGRPFFALTVIGIDEFWRPEFQAALWKRLLNPKKYKALKTADGMAAELERVASDEIAQLIRTSDAWIPMTPDTLDSKATLGGRIGHYVDHFNGHLEAMSQETSTKVLGMLPRKQGESLSDWGDRLEDALTDLATGNKSEHFADLSEEQFETLSANFRLKLQEMGLDYRSEGNAFIPPEEIAATNASRSEQLQNAWDDIAEIHAEQDALDAEAKDLAEQMGGTSVNKPSKRFTAAWLRQEHPDDLTVSSTLSEGDVRKLLAERDDILNGTEWEGAVSTPETTDADLLDYIRNKRGGLKRDPAYWDSNLTGRENRKLWHYLDRKDGGASLDDLGAELANIPEFEHFGIHDGESLWNWLQNADATASRRTQREAEKTLKSAQTRLDEIDAALHQGGERQLTDDEVISAFHRDLTDKKAGKRFKDAWQEASMQRRGAGGQWDRYKAIRDERKANSARLRQAQGLRRQLENAGMLRCEPGSRMESWIKYTVADLQKYMDDDELLSHVISGKSLSRKQLKTIRGRLQDGGSDLPTIIGVKASPDWGPGSIPGVTQLNNLTTMKIMDKVSNMMSRTVFIDQFAKEQDRLLALGIDAEEAFARAGAVAQRESERILYQHAASPIENAGRNIALFLPAYRQATVYWAKVAMRHPFLMSDLRNRGASDYTMARIGDYQFSVPKPFWMASDFADIGIPGFGPMVIMPLRMVNFATGYTRQKDGSFTYTGATKLDSLQDIPPLSFVNKASSPIAWVDDLLWGIFGDNMYALGENQNWAGVVAGGAMRSLFRDQKKRTQLAMNIANAQLSRGIKPDVGGAVLEMRDKPWWQDVADALVPGGQAEGFLAAASRQGFISRVKYAPADLGPRPKMNLWERVFGTEPLSMADAKYEYAMANGDKKKMQAVLDKYPNFKAVQEFYDMNARERAEYLANPSHLWLLPYVEGRNNYTEDGQVLVGAEYWRALKNGFTYRKSMDEYWAKVQADYDDVGWYKALRGLETDKEADLKSAHKLWVGLIKKYSVTPEQAEGRLSDLRYYEHGWMESLPAKDAYTTAKQPTAYDWMEVIAKREGIYDKPFTWSAYAINRRFYEATQEVGRGGVIPKKLGFAADVTLERKRPEGTRQRGIEDKYLNSSAYGGGSWDEGMGKALKIADTLYGATGSPLFDKRRSMSWGTIKETLAEGKGARDYKQTSMAGDEYWKFANVAESMESLGVKVPNHDALNAVAVKADDAYQLYRKQTAGLDSWDPKYMKVRNAYRATLDRLYAPDYAAPLRDGPAGRLSRTWLTQPGVGLKVNRNFVSHVVAQMQKGADPRALAAAYQPARGGLSPTQSAKVRTSTFWASLLSTAVVYRNTMKKGSSEDGKWRGISTSSDAGKKYVARVSGLAAAYAKLDDRFRKQYEGIGGDGAISGWLDALY